CRLAAGISRDLRDADSNELLSREMTKFRLLSIAAVTLRRDGQKGVAGAPTHSRRRFAASVRGAPAERMAVGLKRKLSGAKLSRRIASSWVDLVPCGDLAGRGTANDPRPTNVEPALLLLDVHRSWGNGQIASYAPPRMARDGQFVMGCQ